MSKIHNQQSKFWATVLFLIFTVLWFLALNMRTLVPTDEGRYAEMAREMLATGDWITTRLNGIKYFEKPPLQVWMSAAAFHFFGLGDWQARLWTGLCGWLGVIFVYISGNKAFNARTGLFAAAILGSSLYWVAMGQVNSLDMGVSAMMTICLCAMLLAQHDEANYLEQRNWMLVSWAGMGLAFLSKGLIGILIPGAILVIYTLITRDWKLWTRLHIAKGLFLFITISVPWIILVSERNPEFLQFFFIHEQFERFFTKIHHRDGPWYYFIPLFIAGIVPWLGTVFQSLWNAQKSDGKQFRPRLIALIWAVFIFIFFSNSDSKLPGYIVPIFPALALLIGSHLDSKTSKRDVYLSATLLGTIGVIGLPFTQFIHYFADNALLVPLYKACEPWVAGACFVMIIGGILGFLYERRAQRTCSVLIIAITGFITVQLLCKSTEPYGQYRSGLPLVPAINAQLKSNTPLYAVGLYDQTLPFYLRKTTTLVAHQDELAFGLSQEPKLWIPTLKDFLPLWERAPKAVAIIEKGALERLEKLGAPIYVIAQDDRRVIISNKALLK